MTNFQWFTIHSHLIYFFSNYKVCFFPVIHHNSQFVIIIIYIWIFCMAIHNNSWIMLGWSNKSCIYTVMKSTSNGQSNHSHVQPCGYPIPLR